MEEAHLPTLYQQQIHKTKYARWNDELGRRETWTETVDRYMTFIQAHLTKSHAPLSDADYTAIRGAILSQDVLPSMRALMTAGPALERDHVAAYNCSYIAVNRLKAFAEAMYILMCGTGVGFSVESKYVNELPVVPAQIESVDEVIVVGDSKEGWATAYESLLSFLYDGKIPQWDDSGVRPAGARLKTFGGRASGPQPFRDLMELTVATFLGARGRKLSTEEAHSLMCKVGDIVVVGGVRRSALISMSDPTDEAMRDAKGGEWWEINPHYALANNSAAWEGTPSREVFDAEWAALVASGSGERGFFNRAAAQAKVAGLGKRDADREFGLNPCGEIILRDRQFCNLSQITVRAEDTTETLINKAYIAAVLGTVQATFTNFRFVSDEWKKNCDEEALLGVGMTGVMDNAILNGGMGEERLRSVLHAMKIVVNATNAVYADAFGINRAAATTCMKPAGNSTQLVGSHGSGMHEAYAKHYVRRNRGNKTDPVAQLLYYQGVPTEDEILHPETTWVFSWPMKAPEGAITRDDRTAIERLEHWLVYAEAWCEHNPSITVSVKGDEWEAVGNWVYDHFDKMIGVTFLPHSDHTYQQAPYEEITAEQYERLLDEVPESIDWTLLEVLEREDATDSVKELACVSGACEI